MQTKKRGKATKNEVSFDNVRFKRFLRHNLLVDHLAFTRYFLQAREGTRFKVGQHHRLLSDALSKVYNGEIKRLIINVPPGYTKTEMAVINFVAHGLAINPRSKFIHVSYSDQLALTNSSAVKEVLMSEEYQEFWPVKFKKDASAKKYWFLEEGGGMYATSSGGAITGFRAGRMEEGFSGAFIVDDPIKPDDAFSEIVRERVCNRFTNTFASRLAHEDIPIVVIMQRIHEDDPTGFLLRGGTGNEWHHLVLPAFVGDIETGELTKDFTYDPEFAFGVPMPLDGIEPGPLWEDKMSTEDCRRMFKADSYTYTSQYDQRPSPLGGGLFKLEWFQRYRARPIFKYRFVTADTAQKTKEINDRSTFQCWGVAENDGRLYLLDCVKGKWEAPELERMFRDFWFKHLGSGAAMTTGQLRAAYVEDKSSGTGLIQSVKRGKDGHPPIPVVAIQRNVDKVTRAMDAAPSVEAGLVLVPYEADFVFDFLEECRKFTAKMTHKYDDQVDAMMDAIKITFGSSNKVAGTW